jgi:hypothetical protein
LRNDFCYFDVAWPKEWLLIYRLRNKNKNENNLDLDSLKIVFGLKLPISKQKTFSTTFKICAMLVHEMLLIYIKLYYFVIILDCDLSRTIFLFSKRLMVRTTCYNYLGTYWLFNYLGKYQFLTFWIWMSTFYINIVNDNSFF